MSDNIVTLPDPKAVEDILSAPQPDPVLNVLTTDEERLVAAKILPALTEKLSAALRLDNAKRMDSEVGKLREANNKIIGETLEKIKKDAKPLDPKEVETLLSQEYLTVPVTVTRMVGSEKKTFEFMLCEVPQAVEQRFLKVFKDKLVPHLQELSSIDFKNTTDMASKIQTVIDIVPGALEMMAELAAIALNPRKEHDFVTAEWVADNISSYRLYNIIMGQVAVSRIRDFFSAVYQGLPT